MINQKREKRTVRTISDKEYSYISKVVDELVENDIFGEIKINRPLMLHPRKIKLLSLVGVEVKLNSEGKVTSIILP
jgi:hypothetical protein